MRRADGWPVDPYAVIERAWEGQTVVCIGGGPSLTQKQVDRVRGRARVIAVNDAYRLAPWADICYFADGRWWDWHKDKPQFQSFAGLKVSIWSNESYKIKDESVLLLNDYSDELSKPLSDIPNGIATGRNSGYQAINIAWLAGAARVALIGYDMQAGKHEHWFGDHPIKCGASTFQMFAKHYKILAEHIPQGFEIINCSAQTALTCFRRAALESVFPDQEAAVVSQGSVS